MTVAFMSNCYNNDQTPLFLDFVRGVSITALRCLPSAFQLLQCGCLQVFPVLQLLMGTTLSVHGQRIQSEGVSRLVNR